MSEQFSLFDLPLDMVLKILRYLSPKDLTNLMVTCKKFKSLIISDNALWKIKCKNDLVICGRAEDERYNLLWYHKYRISHNWQKGIYQHKVLHNSRENFMPWLKFYNSQCLILALGSQLSCFGIDQKGIPDCKNKLHWKINVPIVHRQRDIRTHDVVRFVVRNNRLVVANRDGGAVVYQYENTRKPPELIQHVTDCHNDGNSEVSAVELASPDVLVTTSHQSPVVTFWEIRKDSLSKRRKKKAEHKCLKEVSLQDAFGGKCLAVNDQQDKLAVGLDGNKLPQVVDVVSGHTLVNTESAFNNHEVIRDINWHNDHVVCYSTHSGTVQLFDTRISEVVYWRNDIFQSSQYCVRSDGSHAVVSGSAENARCVLYDIRHSKDYAQLYFVQKMSSSPVYSLDFNASKLIAAADRTVAVLNFDHTAQASQIAKDYSFDFNVVKSDNNLNRRLQLQQ